MSVRSLVCRGCPLVRLRCAASRRRALDAGWHHPRLLQPGVRQRRGAERLRGRRSVALRRASSTRRSARTASPCTRRRRPQRRRSRTPRPSTSGTTTSPASTSPQPLQHHPDGRWSTRDASRTRTARSSRSTRPAARQPGSAAQLPLHRTRSSGRSDTRPVPTRSSLHRRRRPLGVHRRQARHRPRRRPRRRVDSPSISIPLGLVGRQQTTPSRSSSPSGTRRSPTSRIETTLEIRRSPNPRTYATDACGPGAGVRGAPSQNRERPPLAPPERRLRAPFSFPSGRRQRQPSRGISPLASTPTHQS